MIRPKRAKVLLHNVCEILQMFVRGRGHELPPTVQRSVKVSKFAKLMCPLVFNKSLSNLAVSLILSRFFSYVDRFSLIGPSEKFEKKINLEGFIKSTICFNLTWSWRSGRFRIRFRSLSSLFYFHYFLTFDILW